MELGIEVVDRADVDALTRFLSTGFSRLAVNFRAQLEALADPPHHGPTREPGILTVGAGVDSVTTTAKRRPWSDRLLRPKWQKDMRGTIANGLAGIAKGRLNGRIETHLRAPAGVIFFDEAILHAEFGVANPER